MSNADEKRAFIDIVRYDDMYRGLKQGDLVVMTGNASQDMMFRVGARDMMRIHDPLDGGDGGVYVWGYLDVDEDSEGGGMMRARHGFRAVENGDEQDLSFSWSSNPDTGLYCPAPDSIGLVTQGTEKVRFDSNGFVGVGTTDPVDALDVRGEDARVVSTAGF